MLVLTRKLQEQIKIGDQVTVTILKIKGGTVRVGIQAPRDVRVVRGELPKQDETAAIDLPADAVEDTSVHELPIAEGGPPAETVISFRLCRTTGELTTPPAETTPAEATTQVSASNFSAGHLPLKRIHDRLGSGPLKQLVASCTMLDT